MAKTAIGIFDSGIGGLTVASEIIKHFSSEDIIYLGDTARVPYGTRGGEIITQYALEMTQFLLSKNVNALVVACNTISATSLSEIKKNSNVPVIDVITPTVREALTVSKSKRIGVIGTTATIASGVYEKYLLNQDKRAKVFSKACPLFVPVVEEGFTHHKAAEIIAQEYLSPLRKQNIDTLILGCTHYPFLKNIIEKVMGKKVTLVDSAKPTVRYLSDVISKSNKKPQRKISICLTEVTAKHKEFVTNYLNNKQTTITKVVL